MPNVSRDIWGNDALLRQAFSWLTRIGAAPKFGSLPIAYYQQDQCAAIDAIESAAKQAEYPLDLSSVRLRGAIFDALPVQDKPTAPRYRIRFARLISGRITPFA